MNPRHVVMARHTNCCGHSSQPEGDASTEQLSQDTMTYKCCFRLNELMDCDCQGGV